MNTESIDEMGPIDYILVDRGLIRILDLVFIAKDEEGNVALLDISAVGEEVAELANLRGRVLWAAG